MCDNPDQVYMEYSTACPPTCKTPNPFCTMQCVTGCQCPHGTVLDESTDRCVAEKECPRKCEHTHATLLIMHTYLQFSLLCYYACIYLCWMQVGTKTLVHSLCLHISVIHLASACIDFTTLSISSYSSVSTWYRVS